jgi:hypothetical protein
MLEIPLSDLHSAAALETGIESMHDRSSGREQCFFFTNLDRIMYSSLFHFGRLAAHDCY